MNQFHYTENIILNTWGGDCIAVHIGQNIVELCDHYCDYYKLPDNYRIKSISTQATFLWVEEKHHEAYNLFIKLGVVTDRIICHEVFHIVYRILNNKGMELTVSSEEAYAYLLDYLYGEVSGIVKRAKIEYKTQQREKRSKNKDNTPNSN